MYMALILDVDGTAVPISSDGSDIDDATRAVVAKAQEAGFKLACATGREEILATPIIRRLGLKSPCIIEGGTRIFDPLSGKTLWEKALSPGAERTLLEIFKRHAPADKLVGFSDMSRRSLGEIAELPEKLTVVYLMALDKALATTISNNINTHGIAAAHITPSWSGEGLWDIHITHPEATKEHAIQAWQDLEKITKAETIGMGDSGNDIPIFESAGLKVAVASGTPDLLELADYIAPAVNDHALQHVIEKFLLNRTQRT